MAQINEFVITVATANGSGSQSANNILTRALFRMGMPVGAKNLFPSNIAGLPTWFSIRANEHGFTARKKFADIVIAMNPQTAIEDQKLVKSGGYFFINQDIKMPESAERNDIAIMPIPFRDIVQNCSDSVKQRKLLTNMIYVGILAELLRMPEEYVNDAIKHIFADKESVMEPNLKAHQAGREYAKKVYANILFPYRAKIDPGGNHGKLLIDGNTATGMGLVFSGCTFAAWYPITPSSSLMESFIGFAEEYRVDEDGKKNFAVIQAEDELASIAMVLGAGWAGARAMTATSGPGLSLMAEAAGLAYYAEIPAVIWDVQRVGPSTGLPTRTMQGDIVSAVLLSHGDRKQIVLMPGTPEECFEFATTAFDLAESLQTLVVVLSDLDLGMNMHVCSRFDYPQGPMNRGKVLDADDLEKIGEFERYKDRDGDGVTYRTLPGTRHPKAGYFTRGTGHNEGGLYSEDPEVYKNNMDRLNKKWETARTMVPKPLVDSRANTKIGLVCFGSTQEVANEVRFLLQKKGVEENYMRIRSLPFSPECEEFLDAHDRIYVVEQNRDSQLLAIMRMIMPQYWNKCHPIVHFDGLPPDAESLVESICEKEKSFT